MLDNLKSRPLRLWEISAGNVHKFVLADSIETVKEYYWIGGGGFIRERPDMPYPPETETLTPKFSQNAGDFTKLEKASLMAMQGMLANSLPLDQGMQPSHTLQPHELAAIAVQYAKAVIEEANK